MFTHKHILAVVGLTVGIVACSQDTHFSAVPGVEIFEQNNRATLGSHDTKIDILWVIDNSGSMQSSQENVARNLESFIQEFRDKGFDFQMAVTTTEAYKAGAGFYDKPEFAAFKDGTSSTGYTGIPIINRDTPNLIDTFLTNMLQGTSGSGDERAFLSFKEALTSPLNSGFPRENSFLSILILSDEDDFSNDTTSFIEDYLNPAIHPVSDYVDFLDGLTSSKYPGTNYSVSAIAVFDEACQTQLSAEGFARKIGHRYAELVSATQGSALSLCDDFAQSLEWASRKIIELATQFPLQSRPRTLNGMAVFVNEVEIPQIDPALPNQNGWSYNADANSIRFHGTAVPPEGAVITVKYFKE